MDAIPTWQVGGASNWLRVCVLVRLAHLQPTHFLHKINKKKKKTQRQSLIYSGLYFWCVGVYNEHVAADVAWSALKIKRKT